MTATEQRLLPTRDQVHRAPKVLLHDHLDGGLRPQTILDLAPGAGHTLPADDAVALGRWFEDSANSGSLERYLETFDHTVAVMQSAENLRRVAQECVEDLATDGVVYAEVRYAPEQHLQGGLSLEQQKRMLLMTLDETAQLDAEIDKLLAAWRGGDIESLASALSAEYERFPELYGPLTENRNRAWMTRLVDLLDDDDDYLVVVGALHLVGRNSVVELLEQRGYEVVQQ